MQPVSVGKDRVTLRLVQHRPNLLPRVLAMVEESDEVCDRPLKVNIVLAKGVVEINQQCLLLEFGRDVHSRLADGVA